MYVTKLLNELYSILTRKLAMLKTGNTTQLPSLIHDANYEQSLLQSVRSYPKHRHTLLFFGLFSDIVSSVRVR